MAEILCLSMTKTEPLSTEIESCISTPFYSAILSHETESIIQNKCVKGHKTRSDFLGNRKMKNWLTFEIKSKTKFTFFTEITLVTWRYRDTNNSADTVDGVKCEIRMDDSFGLTKIVASNFWHSLSTSSIKFCNGNDRRIEKTSNYFIETVILKNSILTCPNLSTTFLSRSFVGKYSEIQESYNAIKL